MQTCAFALPLMGWKFRLICEVNTEEFTVIKNSFDKLTYISNSLTETCVNLSYHNNDEDLANFDGYSVASVKL